MDEKDWLILDVLGTERNITRTAERIYLSQPSLTHRLQQLEKELGIALFVYRGRRGIEFTEQGETMVGYAREMLERLVEVKSRLIRQRGEVSGTLRLGVSRSVALYRLPAVLRLFSEAYPLVDYDITTAVSQDLLGSVSTQKEQVGIIRGTPHWLEQKELIEQEQVCILSTLPVDLEGLPEGRRITFTTDPSLSRIIDNWWKQRFNKPSNVFMHVDNAEIAKRMVQNGLGYAIVPSIVLTEEDRQLYRAVLTGADSEAVTWSTWLLYKQEFMDIPAVAAFVQFVREHYRDSIPSLYDNP
ncbi:LysR family transcriptional regulator [Paenibacillus typhae]|uniref:LysR family transcriptional regulator n=1 Tax=Paenibacillus typhae TaxID=1174501 RepID=UPI001C8D8B84|nr:LysR family transcriptional regulator [Paenibacillus typhae]MBY0012051.1 LysR family transcriptional regulator [Paenibacillus typhae]